jgi:hypothetical protein
MLGYIANWIADTPRETWDRRLKRFGKSQFMSKILMEMLHIWYCTKALPSDCRGEVLREYLFFPAKFRARRQQEADFQQCLEDGWRL